jgi:hypothetical protein
VPICPADVLAGAGVPNEMGAFALSGADTHTCRTHDGGPLAFDFTFERGADTHVYAKGDAVTVDRLKLTVTPATTSKESR